MRKRGEGEEREGREGRGGEGGEGREGGGGEGRGGSTGTQKLSSCPLPDRKPSERTMAQYAHATQWMMSKNAHTSLHRRTIDGGRLALYSRSLWMRSKCTKWRQ
jgi:hypothetical protein